MESWLYWTLTGALALCAAGCLGKLLSLRHFLRECARELSERMAADTNTVIAVSTGDRAARRFGVFYQLRPAFWGRGLGMQAVGQLLDFMAEKYGEVQLLAEVITENTASEKILQHFQFTPCGEEPLERNGKHYTVRRYRKNLAPDAQSGEGNEHWRTAGSTDRPLLRRPKKNS